MVEMIESDIKDTKGGILIFRETPLKEVGIISTGGDCGVYWYREDTDKVIENIVKLLPKKERILKAILEGL